MGLGLFLISGSILALQVLHMRILSVQMWYHHAYIVLTMAMLGFAVAGTVTTLFPKLKEGNVARRLAWLSSAFGVTVVLGHVLQSLVADGMSMSGSNTGAVLLSCLLLLVPYSCGGLVITLTLSAGGNVHRRYAVNLLGSAVGTWLFVLAISPLGGERLLAACALIGPLAGVFFALAGRDKRSLVGSLAVAAAGIAVMAMGPDLLEIRMAKDKRALAVKDGEVIDQRWTPLSRLDLVKFVDDNGKRDEIHILQDGGAGTFMQSKDTWKARHELGAHRISYRPHIRRALATGYRPDVLIIGVGGGPDLREAIHAGAKSVMGIEINPEMARVTGVDYADYNGHIFDHKDVSVVVGEGRSTLRRLDKKFDVIIIAGADTYTAGAAGAFVLSESYLYTQEALGDYFDHLKPEGTLSILRLYDKPTRETLRIFGTAMLELRRRGAKEPSKHCAVIGQVEGFLGGTVFSTNPLHEDVIAFYRTAATVTAPKLEVEFVPGYEKDNPFTRLASAIDAGTEEEFFESYPLKVRPVTDDSPFFFDFHSIWDSAEFEDSACARAFGIRWPIAASILRDLLLQATVLVLALVLLPLVVRHRKDLAHAHAGRHILYFLSLGAGFMLLEISMVQRLILFLGHPTYALTVVLFSFLFFAGIGSALSERLFKDPAKGIRIAIMLIAVLIGVMTFALPKIAATFLHLDLGMRIAVAIVVLAPLTVLMGMPFPLALRRLRETTPGLMPWAIGANGGASVIASALAAAMAMEVGFAFVGLVAGGVYLIGMLCATTGPLAARGT